MKAPVGHAGDIGAHAAMTVAKHKAIDHLVAGEALSGAPQQPYFMKIPCFVAGNKDVADVNLDWTALGSSWSFVALDRMAWAWSSARRHRHRAQELYFIYPNRDRARNQRGADAVALARQLVRL